MYDNNSAESMKSEYKLQYNRILVSRRQWTLMFQYSKIFKGTMAI